MPVVFFGAGLPQLAALGDIDFTEPMFDDFIRRSYPGR
jgi:hypothetical protein